MTQGLGLGWGRRVAVKKFKSVNSEAFNMELRALAQVGVHPNVVRLLEDFQGFGGEDVLVCEYCDGLTLWEVFSQEVASGSTLPPLFISRVLYQLLLALEHTHACGVEHRDVKPENVFLYDVQLRDQQAELKLGDFGWATSHCPKTGGTVGPLPATGAGSLWYAAPELNPPIEGSNVGVGMYCTTPLGRSDIWSYGVIAYLLHVHHNPFQAALRKGAHKEVEHEVIRLVGKGRFDCRSPRWLTLPQELRDLVQSTLQVAQGARPAATDLLRHPFVVREVARSGGKVRSRLEPTWQRTEREDAWARLDGFQRLGWVAVARAVAEPELAPEVVVSATAATRSNSSRGYTQKPKTAYLSHLTRELSSLPREAWLREPNVWPELLRLAFSYLDVDGDGVLSPGDLAAHLSVPNEDAAKAASQWVARWAKGGDDADTEDRPNSRRKGLTPAQLRAALSTGGSEENLLLDEGCKLDWQGWASNAGIYGPEGVVAQEEWCSSTRLTR